MARRGNSYGRPRTGAKAWAPAIDETGPPAAGLYLPESVAGATGWLRPLVSQWLLAELAPGRLMPWVPVAFGAGIAGYFSADHEPAFWAVLPLAAGAVAVAFLARRRPFGFPLAVAAAAVLVGFAVATVHTARVGHPILQSPISSAVLAGFVESREERNAATAL